MTKPSVEHELAHRFGHREIDTSSEIEKAIWKEWLPVRRMLWVCLLAATVSSATQASECSLLVHVTNPRGEDLDSRIVVKENDGRTFQLEHEIGGAKFCGLGILPVQIEVGGGSCNQVIVRNVPLAWDETTVVHVIHDVERCIRDVPRGNACSILIRAYRPDGLAPLPFATIEIVKPYRQKFDSDEHGRVLINVRYGSELVGNIHGSSLSPTEFRVMCTPDQPTLERKVILRSAEK